MPEKSYYVYIVADKPYGTLYIGVTNNIMRRSTEHAENLVIGFTQKYNLKKLVYVESFYNITEAITREKAMKAWKRDWKIQLIEQQNPQWSDLRYSLPY